MGPELSLMAKMMRGDELRAQGQFGAAINEYEAGLAIAEAPATRGGMWAASGGGRAGSSCNGQGPRIYRRVRGTRLPRWKPPRGCSLPWIRATRTSGGTGWWWNRPSAGAREAARVPTGSRTPAARVGWLAAPALDDPANARAQADFVDALIAMATLHAEQHDERETERYGELAFRRVHHLVAQGIEVPEQTRAKVARLGACSAVGSSALRAEDYETCCIPEEAAATVRTGHVIAEGLAWWGIRARTRKGWRAVTGNTARP